MRFYTKQHPFYCGIDLHARTMYVCILNQDGEIRAAPQYESQSRRLSQGHCALSGRYGRRRRMYLHLVLARRPLCPGRAFPLSWATPST